MWSRLYRNHFIMAFPTFDTATQSWAPQADITWAVGSSRDSEFIRSPNRLRTETEAVAFALDMGKVWVDGRLSRSECAPAAYGQITDMVAALKGHLNKAVPKQSPEKTFTFDQFKFALAGQGIEVSEPTLKRSYTALIKLLENKHLSWADARRKLERSQRTLAAAQPSMRRPRGARLPLTENDWRKLG